MKALIIILSIILVPIFIWGFISFITLNPNMFTWVWILRYFMAALTIVGWVFCIGIIPKLFKCK